MTMRLGLIVLPVALVVIAACSSGQALPGPTQPSPAPKQVTPTPTAAGVITGRLVLAGMSTRPVAGTVVLTGPRTYTIQAGTDGTFMVNVVPGTYVGQGRSPLYNGGKGTCRGDAVGAVTAGTVVHLQVNCMEK